MILTHDYDVWAVEVAMERGRRIKPIVSDAPLSAQTRFNNALLNLAVNRIVAVEGGKFTAEGYGALQTLSRMGGNQSREKQWI